MAGVGLNEMSMMLVHLKRGTQKVASEISSHGDIILAWTYIGGAICFVCDYTKRSPEQYMKIVEMVREWFLEAIRPSLYHVAKGILEDHGQIVQWLHKQDKEGGRQHAMWN